MLWGKTIVKEFASLTGTEEPEVEIFVFNILATGRSRISLKQNWEEIQLAEALQRAQITVRDRWLGTLVNSKIGSGTLPLD